MTISTITKNKINAMVNEPPKVAVTGRYPIGEAARHLGVDRHTLNDATKKDPRKGGIKFIIPRGSTRKIFTGRHILDYWNYKMGGNA